MKLRLVASAIRLRVTRAELARLSAGQEVIEDSLVLGDSCFSWSLQMRDQAEPSATIEATDSGPRLVVCYPLASAAEWLHGDEVSLKVSLEPRGPGSPATLLIEKDFQCLIPRDGEQQGDHFPNPAAKAAAKD